MKVFLLKTSFGGICESLARRIFSRLRYTFVAALLLLGLLQIYLIHTHSNLFIQ